MRMLGGSRHVLAKRWFPALLGAALLGLLPPPAAPAKVRCCMRTHTCTPVQAPHPQPPPACLPACFMRSCAHVRQPPLVMHARYLCIRVCVRVCV